MSGSDKTFGSGELARAAGVSTDTLRHYERKGLLAPAHRTSAGYRRYPAAALARVALIQRTLVIGFSLDEIGRVLAERERGGAPCRKVHALVGARLADLEARLREMRALRRELRQLVTDWEARLARTPAGTPAHLLDTLASRAALRSHANGRRRATRGLRK